MPYVHCFCVGKNILCPPFDANMMITLNIEERKIEKVEQSFFLGGKISGISFRIDSFVFFKLRLGEESWYAQTGRDFVVDMRTMEQIDYSFVFHENREQFSQDVITEKILKSPLWKKNMIENEKMGLKEFLAAISRGRTIFQGI